MARPDFGTHEFECGGVKMSCRVQHFRGLRAGMSLFVCDGDRELGQHGPFDASPFELHGDDLTDEEIAVWADKVLSEVAFKKLMDV